MKKKVFLLIAFIIMFIVVALIWFFTKNNYKTYDFGNNSIKSVESIEGYILNLEFYEATIEMTVYSNKNENIYEIKQTYQKNGSSYQEILEPQSVKGVIITYNNDGLTIENTKLNLSKIYKNYPYIARNYVWLSDFIEEYKNNENATLKEEENQVIMQFKNNTSDIEQTLYIDKDTLKPSKLIVKDKNNKILVYIVYKEITINSSR